MKKIEVVWNDGGYIKCFIQYGGNGAYCRLVQRDDIEDHQIQRLPNGMLKGENG